MGRFKPMKQRGNQQPPGQRFHIDDRAVSQAEILMAGEQLSNNVDVHGRRLYMNAPPLGLGEVAATGINVDTGSVETAEGEDPMPVALFEPERALMSHVAGRCSH